MAYSVELDQLALDTFLKQIDGIGDLLKDPETLGKKIEPKIQYRQRERWAEINKLPFSAFSLRLGRKEGTFGVDTGLTKRTSTQMTTEANQIVFGAKMPPYAANLDQIIRRKGMETGIYAEESFYEPAIVRGVVAAIREITGGLISA